MSSTVNKYLSVSLSRNISREPSSILIIQCALPFTTHPVMRIYYYFGIIVLEWLMG